MEYRDYIRFLRFNAPDGSPCIAANSEVLSNGTRWYKVYNTKEGAPSFYNEYGELLWLIKPNSVIEAYEEIDNISKFKYFRIMKIETKYVYAVPYAEIVSF